MVTPVDVVMQLAAGAEVIVTQPPLVWSVFESWYNDIHRRGWIAASFMSTGIFMLADRVIVVSCLNLDARSKHCLVLCCRSGLTNDVDVVIGLPFLNSTNNLRFWITLCDAWRVEGIDAVLRDFQQADAGGKTEMKQFCTAWNADLIAKVRFTHCSCRANLK